MMGIGPEALMGHVRTRAQADLEEYAGLEFPREGGLGWMLAQATPRRPHVRQREATESWLGRLARGFRFVLVPEIG